MSDLTNSDTNFVTARDTLKTSSSTLTTAPSDAAETATSPLRAAAPHLQPTSHPDAPRSPHEASSSGANGTAPKQVASEVATTSEMPQHHHEDTQGKGTAAVVATSVEQQHERQKDNSSNNNVPGTAHFSVPPSVPPNHGVYVYPQEAFVISDLDTGRKFEVNQQFWIKDVDSGAVYIVQDDNNTHNTSTASITTTTTTNNNKTNTISPLGNRPPSSSISSAGGTARHISPMKDTPASTSSRSISPINTSTRSGGGTSSNSNDDGVLITDLISGEKLSIKDFEEAMGYTKVTTKETTLSPQPLSPSQLSALQPHGGKVEQLAQRGLITFNNAASASASWVKNKTAIAMSIVGPNRKESPVTGFIGSSSGGTGSDSGNMSGGGFGIGEERNGMGGSFGSTDPNGIPVRVTVHRKTVKELADLRLVQEIQGHQGVVWAMKFSRNGRYLATAGQDGIIRVWESIPNRGSINTGSTSPGPGSTSGTPVGGGSSPNQQPSTPTQRHNNNITATTSTSISQQQQQPEIERVSATSVSSVGNTTTTTTNTTSIDTSVLPVSPTVGASSCPGVAVIKNRPYRTYKGHKQDVLDVAWSRTHFLLSASMDKTVRLWHVSMDECLRVFKHSDFVTAIDFHPTDDKLFVSGSIDGKIRLWNVPDQRVMSWQDVHEMVTAVGYSNSGTVSTTNSRSTSSTTNPSTSSSSSSGGARAVVGTMRGKCRFYSAGERTGLEYEAQLDVKNKRGQHSRGKKVTGVVYSPVQQGSLLVTSNDSRIRLYDGYALRCKFKGHTNRSTQIKASFSPRGDYVICGSDTGWVYVWNTNKQPNTTTIPSTNTTLPQSSSLSPGGLINTNKEKNSSCECFQVANDIVTVAIFAPESSQRTTSSTSTSSVKEGSSTSGAIGSTSRGGVLPSSSSSTDPSSSSLNNIKTSIGSGSTAGTAWAARGQVILAAGYGGEIKIYENMATHPQTL